tara:strand:+ start:630 stop:1280 length:651 start_codon:yes stop_codon:yes gene_type:complete
MKTIEIIETPKDGCTYLWDASINTSAWLTNLFGEPLDLDIPNEAWDDNLKVRELCEDHASVEANEPIQLVSAMRDNVYNGENDFNQVFTFSVYSTTDDADEWYYGNDAVYIAVCLHLGGDVRGHYGNVQVFRCDDSDKVLNFLDWVIGWHVVRASDGEPIEQNDRFQIGYAQNPTSELESALDGDYSENGKWIEGAFHAKINGEKVICYPETNAVA